MYIPILLQLYYIHLKYIARDTYYNTVWRRGWTSINPTLMNFDVHQRYKVTWPTAIVHSHDIPSKFPSDSHHIPSKFPSHSHHFPITFPSYSFKIPITFPSLSHQFPIIFLQNSQAPSSVVLWRAWWIARMRCRPSPRPGEPGGTRRNSGFERRMGFTTDWLVNVYIYIYIIYMGVSWNGGTPPIVGF